MSIPWEGLAHIQNFFRLDFIFSGLEVSSWAVFSARVAALLVLGGGLIYGIFRLMLKLLDCVQALVTSLGPFPKSFFLLLLLVIPLSPDSLGAVWIGYILVALSLLGVAAIGALIVVLWRHGIDQMLRVLYTFRSRVLNDRAAGAESTFPPDNVYTESGEPPLTAGNLQSKPVTASA
jgi:hypothetical protein